MVLEVGQRVGDYEVLALLASGGMGSVYKVRNIISNREEAMKVLLPDFASDHDLAARLVAEIRTLAGLEHPNIAQLRTAFRSGDQFVMVMEYVVGTTLEKMATQGGLSLDKIIDYSMQALAALNYAHDRGVTHRDIKPANIMITDHGVVKLMDFGIAKSNNNMQLTRPGTTMGSVYYMSPEQVRGETVDARSDVYSFGVMLYEMLTGRKPFQAETSYSVLNAQLNEEPTPPMQINPVLPQELNNLVLRAMAKQPDKRFQSADDFRNALKGPRELNTVPQAMRYVARAAQPVPHPPVAKPPEFTPVPVPSSATAPCSDRSNRGLWMGLGAVAAILALIAVAALLPRILMTHASQKPAAADIQAPPLSPNGGPGAQPATPTPSATPQPNLLTTVTPETTPPSPEPVSQLGATGTPKPPAINKPLHTPSEHSTPKARIDDSTPAEVAVAPTRVQARKLTAEQLRAMAFVITGQDKLKTQDYVSAENNFRVALNLDPDNSAAREGLAAAKKALGE